MNHRKDLIRLMQALFLPGADVIQQAPWHPNTDVYRTPDGWLIKFELAGVRPEDIDLQVLGNRMTLRGVRRDSTSQSAGARDFVPKGTVHYRLEIAYSHFERAFELPCDLNKATITTDYQDGMLLVRIAPPCGEEPKQPGQSRPPNAEEVPQ